MIRVARIEASNYRFIYSQPIPLKVRTKNWRVPSYSPTFFLISLACHPPPTPPPPPPPKQTLVDRVSGYLHQYTVYGGLRPVGASITFASFGPDGPELYIADPSGASWVRSIASFSGPLKPPF